MGTRIQKIFFTSTVQRRDRNKLERIKDKNGNWVEGQGVVSEGIKDYFADIYAPDIATDFDDCLNFIPSCVTHDMNQKLTLEISDSDIEKAVFELGPWP